MADALEVRSPSCSVDATAGPERWSSGVGCRAGITAPADPMFLALVPPRGAAASAEPGPRIVDLLPLAVLCLDAGGRALLVNAAWTVLTGRAPDSELGAGWLDAFAPGDRTEIAEWICAAVQDTRAVARDIRVDTVIGERLLRFAGQPRVDRVGGSTMYVLTATDVTEQVALEARLTFDAFHDSLTGLTNRGGFVESTTRLTSDAIRTGRTNALLLLDLDGFKIINDAGGHGVGDEVLRVVAERIRAVVRPTDVVARIGGDEFAVVIVDIKTPTEAQALAGRILRTVADPIVIHGDSWHVGASIGISVTTDDRVTDLLERADKSLYAAKTQGKGRIVVDGDSPAVLVPGRLTPMLDSRLSARHSTVSRSSTPPPFHAVHLYDDDDELLPALAGYVGAGLVDEGAVTVVATPAHRKHLNERLGAEILDDARASGRYVELDAAETLSRIMRAGYPDLDLFQMVVGTPVLNSVARYPRFRVYGEMVGLLWAAGNPAASLRLEGLSNDLQRRVAFPLLCSYSDVGYDGDGRDQIMRRHSTSLNGGS